MTACLCIAGCSRKTAGVMGIAATAAPERPQAIHSDTVTARRAGDMLAYEHTVAIELGSELFEGRMTEIRTSCASRNEWTCVVLDISSDARLGVPSGSIRMRMAPAAVDPLIALASRGGRITSRNTHAED